MQKLSLQICTVFHKFSLGYPNQMSENVNENSGILIYPLLILINFLSLVFFIFVPHEMLLWQPLGALIMLFIFHYDVRWKEKKPLTL